MLKQRIQEIIAEGRIRNLSDEEIAELVVDAIGGDRRGKQGREQQPQEVDSDGD